MLRIRRVLENIIPAVAVVDDVIAQAKVVLNHRGQRLDAGGIDLAKLLDPAEDVVELWNRLRDLVFAQRKASELRDVANFFFGNGHGGAASRAAPPHQATLLERIADWLAIDEDLPPLNVANFEGRAGEIAHRRDALRFDRQHLDPAMG